MGEMSIMKYILLKLCRVSNIERKRVRAFRLKTWCERVAIYLYSCLCFFCHWTKYKGRDEGGTKLLWNAENFENFLSYIADGRKSRWWKFLNVFSQPSLAEIYRTLLSMLLLSYYVEWIPNTEKKLWKSSHLTFCIKFNFHKFSTWIQKILHLFVPVTDNISMESFSSLFFWFEYICNTIEDEI